MKQCMLSVSFQEEDLWPRSKLRPRKPPKEKDVKPSVHARGQPAQVKPVSQHRFSRGESEKILTAARNPSETWSKCNKPKVCENKHSWGESQEIQPATKHTKKSSSCTVRCDTYCEGSKEKSQSSAYDSTSRQVLQDWKWINLERDKIPSSKGL